MQRYNLTMIGPEGKTASMSCSGYGKYVKYDDAKVFEAQAWGRGVRNWAWWRDGIQYVGTCGMTLQEALIKNPYKEA